MWHTRVQVPGTWQVWVREYPQTPLELAASGVRAADDSTFCRCVCLCLCLCVCVSVCLCVCMSVCLCVCV